MSGIESGEHGSPTNSLDARAQDRPASRLTASSRRVIVVAIALFSLAISAASANADETPVTFTGTPLTVSVGPLGQCQSSYPNHGTNFYPPAAISPIGDCGFFLAFPTAGTGQPPALQAQTFGFNGSAGPHGLTSYEPVSQSEVKGEGTVASPFTQITVFKVVDSAKKEDAVITETTTYVNGEPQFISTYTVKNVTNPATKIYFRAIYAGDLYVDGDDAGSGVFLNGPPRFIGGLNAAAGVLGGFVEAPEPALPWSAFQELPYPTVWETIESTVDAPQAFNGSVEPSEIDNAAGVEWDQLRETGLAAGDEQSFTVINRTQIPSTLRISPTSQTLTQGQTETINVTALDLANQPYAGKVLHYTVSGNNAQLPRTATLNAAGQAQISYVGSKPGLDTIQLYVDLVGNGVQTPGDPAGTATVTFLPLPPAPMPNSTYKVQSIKANSDGTLTVVFIPAQGGKGAFVVTVPTGSIARNEAIAARKAKKCKKNQIKLKGKCQPKITTSGKVSATGVAGVPLTLTVKPSGKVTSALKKGKTVHLTATLTYTSALGGAPTVKTFHVTVKGKKKGHKKH
jgi:hypothetical protein